MKIAAGIFILEDADHADRGRGINRAPFGLVVERDVARNNRRAERLAGLADAADALRKLPHDLRPLRRSEVEAIGDRNRPSAADGDISCGLRDGLFTAFVRIEKA